MKNLIRKAWEIIRAWFNLLRPTSNIKEIAWEREQICRDCPFMQTVEFMGGVDVCSKCHCPIPAKTHSPENSCPAGKWKR